MNGRALITLPKRKSHRLILVSDLHVGTRTFDRKALEASLGEEGDILINGDILDAIVPGDKRYLDEEVAIRTLTGQLDLAAEVLAPFASRIVMMGNGNHEDHWKSKGGIDLVKELRERLHIKCALGGQSGVINIPCGKETYRLFYAHGSGKGANHRDAMASLLRTAAWVEADIYWEGHRHKRGVGQDRQLRWKRGRPVLCPVWYIYTGSFSDPHQLHDITRDGTPGNYAVTRGYPASGLGGCVAEVSQSGIKVVL